MCGLAGVVGVRAPRLVELLDRMDAVISNRGPDGAGRWLDEDAGVALGHRRLAILDLSPTGHQPMTSADGRWTIVFNGEIFDHGRHRRDLERAEVHFRGTSDTEVLLELIARLGPREALRRVDGMFAVALWDREEQTITLARDRMGEKPLLHVPIAGGHAFASDLRALMALPGGPAGINRTALTRYVQHGFIRGQDSILAGVAKVPPGSLVRIGRSGAVSEPEYYWSLSDIAVAGQADPLPPDPHLWASELDVALRRSVRDRLVADVPVGIFLSGGIDSSLVAAIASQVSSTHVRTFTVSVGGDADEARHASAVARHLGTDHLTLQLPDVDAVSVAERVGSAYDEPFADPSAMPTLLLCQAARTHVTVALGGDGADELFAGYNRYRVADDPIRRLQRLPRPLRRQLARTLRAVPVQQWDRVARAARIPTSAVGTKAHKLAGLLATDTPTDAHTALAHLWDPRIALLDPQPAPRDPEPADRSGEPLLEMLLADQLGLLPDDMLVKTDRAGMAAGLEVRTPFLAHDLVELSWRMPPEARRRRGQGKWVARQVLAQHVPKELWNRPKVGFDPPLADWLRGPLREWAGDLLSPARLARQGLVRSEPVAAAFKEHLDGRVNHDYALWCMLMLQEWLEGTGGRHT